MKSFVVLFALAGALPAMAKVSGGISDSGFALLTKSRNPGITCNVYVNGRTVGGKEIRGSFLPYDIDHRIQLASRAKLQTGTEITDATTLVYSAGMAAADHVRTIELLTTTANRKIVIRERNSPEARNLVDLLDWVCPEVE